MKIVIEGLPKSFAAGGKVYTNLKPYPGDKYGAKKAGTPGSNASKMTEKELNDLAEQVGYNGPDDVKSFQEYLLSPQVRQNFPEIGKKIDELHTQYGMPTAGVPAEGNWGYRWDVFKDLKTKGPKFEEEKPKEPATQQEYQDLNREYNFIPTGPKPRYDEQGLPLYQVAPDLLGYASALNTYPYYTPDYTHWEIAPPTLNIQPQLEDIDAATRALYQTTTGNPALDSARKQAGYAEGLKNKQTAFGRKQNYDAQGKYMADQYNIAARTQEQNLDTQATDRVYNQFRALAKDNAATQRNMILQDIAKKQGLNAANEAAKSLYMNNFFPNVVYDANGNMLNVSGNTNMFSTRYPYGTAPQDLYRTTSYSQPSDIMPLTTKPATVMTPPSEDLQIVPVSKKATLKGLTPTVDFLNTKWNFPDNQPVAPDYITPGIPTPLNRGYQNPQLIMNSGNYLPGNAEDFLDISSPNIRISQEHGGMIHMKPIKGNKYKLPY